MTSRLQSRIVEGDEKHPTSVRFELLVLKDEQVPGDNVLLVTAKDKAGNSLPANNTMLTYNFGAR